jgi:outer membrane protein OmpA-like peptidoglycan-associated protein/opacity protein-like surface antigen
MIVEDIDIDSATTDNIITINHEYGYDGGLFVGYDLGGFRLEAEVAYKKADLSGFTNLVVLPGEGPATFPGGRDFAGGSTSALSFMLNGMLDFGDDDGVSGFVGGGIGMARVKFNNQRVFANTAPFLDDSDSRLAWQLFAGVRQAISDNIDVTVKYRFFNVPDIKLVAVTGGAGTVSQDVETRFRSHSLLGGLTFNFGGDRTPPAPDCWDGSRPGPDGSCPTRPIPDTVCPDGSKVPAGQQCPPIPVQTKVCPPNGPTIPVTETCPRIEVGPFVVFFDWDKDELTPQATAILDNAAAAYATTGNAQVQLAGHADRSGPDDYNIGLSQRRAANVRAYLTGRGIPDGVITSEAFGESRPLVETADGVREPQNRRVEITFGPGSGW